MGVVFIRQPITDDHKLEWVFFIVYVKKDSFRILKRVL